MPENRAAAQSDVATPVATPSLPATLSDATLRDFEADIEAALQTFQVPGAAVSLVQGDEIVFNRGFGVRDLASGEPVTPRTRFRIGSITKSMTALLLATLVDEGVFGWDDRVVDLWPEFEAPTPELTQSLRLRDLLGMASGIAESTDLSLAAVEFFMSAGTVSAGDVLRSIAALPVIAPPDTTFSYNNTLYAAAAYLGLLAQGTTAEMLEETYAAQVQQRVFEPIGMADAAILDDPRPLGDDFAVGYTRDIFGDPSPLPFVSLAGLAPAGSGLASATDMARYLITQMHHGVAPGGTRVVSATNLDEMHRPGILARADCVVPIRRSNRHRCPELRHGLAQRDLPRRPATALAFRGDRWLLRPDGVLPRGAARLRLPHQHGARWWAVQPLPPGQSARSAVRSEPRPAGLPCRRHPDAGGSERPSWPRGPVPSIRRRSRRTWGCTRMGFGCGWTMLDALFLDHDIRSMPLLALSDGSYVVAAGPDVVLEQPVSFEVDANGVPVMTITGFAPVRWLTGG